VQTTNIKLQSVIPIKGRELIIVEQSEIKMLMGIDYWLLENLIEILLMWS